ncbi:MAG TPA: siphovirus Gp157 family protein [Pyrinomonadaceae bacterium]|jgi:hypothetical protein
MRTLFAISDDLLALDALLEEMGGDVSEFEVDQAIDRFLSDITTERDQKLDNYAAYIRELEARAAARKEEAHRLAERMRIDTNRAQALKNRLQYFFQLHQLKTVETRRFKLTLCQNGGKLPLNLAVQPEALPEEFQTVIVQANKGFDSPAA